MADWLHTGLGLASELIVIIVSRQQGLITRTAVQYGFGHHASDLPPYALRKAIMVDSSSQAPVRLVLTGSAVLVRMPNHLQIPRCLHKTRHHLSLSPTLRSMESEEIRPHPRRYHICRINRVRHRLGLRV